MPSVPNWNSPTNTYTASGTWSKGSLADSAFVWAYIVGGGGKATTGSQGGFDTIGGKGGGALLVYMTAAILNNAAYVIGAANTGNVATESKITLADGRVFSTTSGPFGFNVVSAVTTTTNLLMQPQIPSIVTIKDSLNFSHVFKARDGRTTSYNANTTGDGAISTYAGNGGAGVGGGQGGTPTGSPFNGVVPGGGGGSVNGYYTAASEQSRGLGAAGNFRVYHV
jgi:hypothetical protein